MRRGAPSVSMFSDSIVLSCIDKPQYYLPFLSAVATMCFEFLGAASLFCRGGIAPGFLFHNGQIVFGEGLVTAYEIESTYARYPRVVLHESVIETLCSTVDMKSCPLQIPKVEMYYRVDKSDKVSFLDYLGLLFEFRCNGCKALSDEEESRGITEVRRRVLAMFHGSPAIDSIKTKYYWFFDYFNEIVDQLGLGAGYKIIAGEEALTPRKTYARSPSQRDSSGSRIRCPLCGWSPRKEDKWFCTCGHEWNTFDTGGVCPACTQQWTETQCLSCSRWSPHSDWYSKE